MSTPIIRLQAVPSSSEQRETPGLRTAASIHPTVSAYARANPAGLFQIASNRIESERKPLVRSEDLNVPLTIATAAALATLVPIALRQLKVVRRLPDPEHHLFNSNRIISSHKSRPFGVPDSLLGLASYSATLTLVLMAPKSGAARRLVGPKLALDSAVAATNTVRQITGFGKLCSWCLLTVAATAAMAVTGRNAFRLNR